jgi:3-hydroxyacyl-[acyl-carrier-protein] dehydratase
MVRPHHRVPGGDESFVDPLARSLCPHLPGDLASTPYGAGMSNFPAPTELLAHRPPFLLVDELVALEPGVSATGLWRLTGDEYFFPGHFPGRPTLPGVLMCESIAQVGACALLADERFAGKLPLFGGLDNARFRRQVVPGDELTIEVELGRMSARAGKGAGRVSVGGELATSCDLMFVFADR